MSNPAVIILDKVSSIKKFKRFVIEDNIGESIHIHIDNMRLDFTIEEFLSFSKVIRNSIKEMDILKGFNLSSFDESFLKNCSHLFSDLVDIKIEKIKLKDLTCIKHNNFFGEIYDSSCTIDKTDGYKYLNNTNSNFLKYSQKNYFGINNKSRLLSLYKSVKENGYPLNDSYIILFNKQNIIRDGQHRAIVLAHLFGLNHEIRVLRFYFSGSKHKTRFFYLGLRKLIKHIFSIIKFVLKRILKSHNK